MAQYSQPYDAALKSLFLDQAQEILRHLLPEAEIRGELDTEVVRPPMRTDRVYLVYYRGQMHILHIEFQTSNDRTLSRRLLVYHALLFHQYEMPVISVVIYLFPGVVACSPLREISGQEEILTFHFKEIELWKMDARGLVAEHALCLYPLLAAMKDVDDELLLKALQELVEAYSNDQVKLARQLVWFGVIVRRSGTLKAEQKQRVEDRLKVFESLFEQDPYIQELRQRFAAEGKAEGKAEGTVVALQNVIIDYVERHFPALIEIAKLRVIHINAAGPLLELFRALDAASDETAARQCFNRFEH